MLNKHRQALRVIQHILWIVAQPSYFGTLEVQFQNSTPTYIRRNDGRKMDELPENELIALEVAQSLITAAQGEHAHAE